MLPQCLKAKAPPRWESTQVLWDLALHLTPWLHPLPWCSQNHPSLSIALAWACFCFAWDVLLPPPHPRVHHLSHLNPKLPPLGSPPCSPQAQPALTSLGTSYSCSNHPVACAGRWPLTAWCSVTPASGPFSLCRTLPSSVDWAHRLPSSDKKVANIKGCPLRLVTKRRSVASDSGHG